MSDYDPNYVHQKVYFVVGCKAVIYNREGKILVLRRTEKSGMGGVWAFPGGAVEDNESPYDGIKREIAEEVQITVSDLKIIFIKHYKNKDNDNVLIIGFTCIADSENIVLNWEHDEFQWLTIDEALKLVTTPDARTFLEKQV